MFSTALFILVPRALKCSSLNPFKHSFTRSLMVHLCWRVVSGGSSTLPTEGGAVNSDPETNIRLQLSIRGDYDRRPAQPAHHAATIGPGWYFILIQG